MADETPEVLFYTDVDVIKARFDPRVLTRLTDDNKDGQPDEDVIKKAIRFRENFVEQYLVNEYPDLENLREEKPETVQMYITDLVVYDLYFRKGAVPSDVKDQYLLTLQQLDKFGTPVLIIDPPVELSGQTISTNMTADDLGEFTENGEDLPWSEIM